MIKKFDEFVNEGLITDYKKQVELENREISGSDKKFVFDVLSKLTEIDMPFVFTCKNCEIINAIDENKFSELRDKTYHMDDVKDNTDDVHISEKSVLRICNGQSQWLKGEYKNIFRSIYKWFREKYEKMDLTFEGKIKVSILLELKEKIKRELF